AAGRARAQALRPGDDAPAHLRALRRRGDRARHDGTSGTGVPLTSTGRGESMMQDGTNLPTVCVLCSHNCGIRVDVKDGRITAVRGDETNPITKGYLCNKAFSIQHYVEHGDRVPYPMRRRADGTFEEIDWDTAIGEIAAK